MNDTALIPFNDLHKLDNKQMKMIERMYDKHLAVGVVHDVGQFTREILQPLVKHPGFGMVLAWLLIEQLNIHQAFGPTRAYSDASASQIATILMTAQIIDSVVPG